MADRKLAYAASSALTFTSLNSLAASSTWVAGAESTAVDNSSNLYLDYLLTGKITAGAANTQAGIIEVWVIPENDDSTWPDVFDGTDSAETVTSRNVLAGCGRLAKVISTDATNSRVYTMHPVSVASLFGGTCPRKFVVFVTHTVHTTTTAIAASGNTFTVKGVYETIA